MKKEKNDNYSNKMPGNLKKESLFTYFNVSCVWRGEVHLYMHRHTAQHVCWIQKLDKVHGSLHSIHSGKYMVICKMYPVSKQMNPL